MGLRRPGLVRNAMGSLAILAIVAFIALGLPLIDRRMPSSRPVAGDVPFTVGGGVTVVPPAGARIDLTRTRPGDQRGTALFVAGGVRIAVLVSPFGGELEEAAARVRAKITNTAGYQVTRGERAVETQTGVTGRRGSYSSPGRLGQYGVFVHDGVSVEVTASGPEDQLRALAPQLDASLRTISVAGPVS